METREPSSEVVNRMIRIADYLPHPSNYNIHPQDQIERLARSLRTFGQARSVVVWDHPMAEGIKGWMVAGHGIRQAAEFIGMNELRADILPASWSDAKVDAYLVADNELSKFADPDDAQLAFVLERVRDADPSLADAAGFDDVRFGELMAKVAEQSESSVDLGIEQGHGDEFADDKQFEEGAWLIKVRIPEHLVSDEDMKADLAFFCTKHDLAYKIGRG